MNFIEYVLMIHSHNQEGWHFSQNQAGHLVAFHPNFGSRIFHSEEEFKEWLNR
jgi:hypothetical protein